MLLPVNFAQIRHDVLQWAVSTACEGESGESILQRAQAFLDFIVHPLRTDVFAAAQERDAADKLQ